MKFFSTIRPAAKIFFTGLLLSKVVVAFWAVNKGFDIGDESFYLAGLKHYHLYETFDYFFIMGKILGAIKLDIISSRVLRIFIDLICVFVFAWGAFRWLDSKESFFKDLRVSFRQVLFFCYLGSFLSIYSRGTSYNEITNLLVYLVIAIFFFLSSQDEKAVTKQNLFFAMLMGLFSGVQFFVKFPAGVILFFLMPLLLVIVFKKAKASWTFPAAFYSGFAVVLFLFFHSYGGFFKWVDKAKEVYHVNQTVGYNIVNVLVNYLKYDSAVFIFIAPAILVFTLVALTAKSRGWWKSGVESRDKAVTFGFIVSMPFLYLIYAVSGSDSYAYLFSYFISTYIFILLAVFFLFARNGSHKIDFRNSVFIFLMLTVPFIIVVGTNGSLFEGIFQSIHPWFVLVGIFIQHLRLKMGYKIFSALLLTLLTSLTMFQFYYNYVFHPWGISKPLTEQKYLAAGFEPVLFDDDTKIFWESYKRILDDAGYKENDPIIALDMMIGLTYFVKAISPKTPYYFFGDEFNCYYLKKFGSPERKPIIVYRREPSKVMMDCLNNSYLDFSNSYFLAGKIKNAYHSEFKHFYDSDESEWLFIYAPASR